MICYLGLGSNLQNRKENIKKAIAKLNELSEIELIKQSSIIETKPFGKTDQPDFLNCAIKIDTELSAEELLRRSLQIEDQLGRMRIEKWGPRNIDIDILFYGNEIIDTNKLTIPHPGIAIRSFILQSLIELCPDFIHPKLNKTINKLNEELK